MSRKRVHNLLIFSDGCADGGHVSLEKPSGGAGALFNKFEGRVIHGVHGMNDPVAADRAMVSLCGQGIGAEFMGWRKFGPQSSEWPDDGWDGWKEDAPSFLTPASGSGGIWPGW